MAIVDMEGAEVAVTTDVKSIGMMIDVMDVISEKGVIIIIVITGVAVRTMLIPESGHDLLLQIRAGKIEIETYQSPEGQLWRG